MSSLLDTTRNFSLYTIPAAWALSIIPHFYAVTLYERATSKKYDTTKPRAAVAAVAEDRSLDTATKNRITRAEGAQQNGFENLGLFAAAVVAGNYAGLDAQWLNALSGGYLVSRAVYNYVYVNNDSATMANVRTGVFLGGIGLIFTLFIQAGNKLRSSVV